MSLKASKNKKNIGDNMKIEILDCSEKIIGAVEIVDNEEEGVSIGTCDGDISITDIDTDDTENKVRIQLKR